VNLYWRREKRCISHIPPTHMPSMQAAAPTIARASMCPGYPPVGTVIRSSWGPCLALCGFAGDDTLDDAPLQPLQALDFEALRLEVVERVADEVVSLESHS
jgi:hypothetical protein